MQIFDNSKLSKAIFVVKADKNRRTQSGYMSPYRPRTSYAMLSIASSIFLSAVAMACNASAVLESVFSMLLAVLLILLISLLMDRLAQPIGSHLAISDSGTNHAVKFMPILFAHIEKRNLLEQRAKNEKQICVITSRVNTVVLCLSI